MDKIDIGKDIYMVIEDGGVTFSITPVDDYAYLMTCAEAISMLKELSEVIKEAMPCV